MVKTANRGVGQGGGGMMGEPPELGNYPSMTNQMKLNSYPYTLQYL